MKDNAWRIKMQEGRHMKTSLEKYLPLTLLQGFERLACERMLETEHKLHILTPLLWLSRCVLFSWCRGPLHRGFSEAPLGQVWPSLPHLVSNPLGVCWQLLRGFSECPLGWMWPSLPHLVSTVWKSPGNCIGGFPSAPSVGCGLPYHIWSLLSGIRLATASGVSEGPLGWVWSSLPHLVSTVWKSAGNCIGGFRGPPRSGVAFPTTSRLYCLEVCWQLLWDPTQLN